MDYKNELQSDDDFDCSNSYNDNNNSNSGFNTSSQANMPNPNGLSKAELRKTNKPIMEKRRRARINHCLNELKSLILEAMKKDPARHTKLEKADILEMTVKHLQSVQRQQLNMAIQTDPTVIHKFKTGFIECAEEVSRYVTQIDGVDTSVRQRLTNHLSACANNLEQLGSMTNFNNGYRGHIVTAAAAAGNAMPPTASNAAGIFGSTFNNALAASTTMTAAAGGGIFAQDYNNNNNHGGGAIQMGGVQLIPSRLPSGEFALIMPNSINGAAQATQLLNQNVTAFSWPATQQQLNTTNSLPLPNFQRVSAFSKPMHNTLLPVTAATATTAQQIPKLQQSNLNNTYTHTATAAAANLHSYNPTAQMEQNHMHHNTTATTSPPLSPVSSVSSHGDDSIMHTSSDFAVSRPATPPYDSNACLQLQQQHQPELLHNFSGVFPTPTPSSAESSFSSTTSASPESAQAAAPAVARLSTNLQLEQVTSTSGSELLINRRKRSFSDVTAAASPGDSCDSSDYKQSAKKSCNEVQRQEEYAEDSDSMWRPW